MGNGKSNAAKGLKNIVSHMENHPSNEEFQLSGFRMLAESVGGAKAPVKSSSSAGTDRDRVIGSGGLRAVIGAMKTHHKSAEVQSHGCIILNSLAQGPNDRERRAKIMAANGVEMAIKAMERHISSADVQECAMMLLRTLASRSSMIRERIVAQGGLEALLRAMEQHTRSAQVQRQAAFLLRGLVKESGKRCAAIAALGAADVLQRAMQRHVLDDKLQEQCSLLLDFVGQQENINRANTINGRRSRSRTKSSN